MAPFYGWGSTASRLEPIRGGSLLFTIKLPEIPVWRCKFYSCVLIVCKIRTEKMFLIKVDLIYIFAALCETNSNE